MTRTLDTIKHRVCAKLHAIAGAALMCVAALCCQSADGGLIGGLSALQDIGGNQLQSVFSVRVSADLLPTDPDQSIDLDFIDLDVVHSSINGVALTEFSKITFEATGIFAAWQESVNFGIVGDDPDSVFRSRMSLDGFTFNIVPRTITDTDAFTVGTFTIDYSMYGLGIGDTITLDITGVDDGQGSRTSSGVISTNTVLSGNPLRTDVYAFDFSTSLGPGIQSYTFSNSVDPPIVPEPTSSLIFLITAGIGLTGRHRRSSRHQQACRD